MTSEPPSTPSASPAPAHRSPLVAIFLGPGGLRAGWRLLVFLGAAIGLDAGLTYLVLQLLGPGAQTAGWTASGFLVPEALSFLVAVVVALGMARFERRTLGDYGLTGSNAFGRRFWVGFLWGAATPSAVVLMVWLAGGYTVHGLAIHGAALVHYTLLWGLGFLVASLFEELFFRGYTLYTLADGIGFWPAALLLSLLFGALHYFTKPMESWVDFLSVGLIGLFFCLAIRRTGDLWWAIGWHFAFNFFALFVYGGPNTGNEGKPMPGHLLDSTITGPQWLTGGPMGFEASLFILPVVAVLFALFLWRYKGARFPRPAGKSGAGRASV